MKVPDYRRYQEEKSKWKNSGAPLRTAERIKEIFEICSSNECGKYLPITDRLGQCGECSCFLRNEGEKANKIAMATTRCPLEEPKWVEDVEIKEADQFGQPPSPRGGCGCS